MVDPLYFQKRTGCFCNDYRSNEGQILILHADCLMISLFGPSHIQFKCVLKLDAFIDAGDCIIYAILVDDKSIDATNLYSTGEQTNSRSFRISCHFLHKFSISLRIIELKNY